MVTVTYDLLIDHMPEASSSAECLVLIDLDPRNFPTSRVIGIFCTVLGMFDTSQVSRMEQGDEDRGKLGRKAG